MTSSTTTFPTSTTLLFAASVLFTIVLLAFPAPVSAKYYCKTRQIDPATAEFIGTTSMGCYDTAAACFTSRGCAASGAGCAYTCEECKEVGETCPPSGAASGAAEEASGGPRKLQPRGIGNISLQALAGRFANVLIGISGSVALLMFVYGGFMMLTSAGDDSKVGAGKNAIKWATIGLIVIFGAYAILSALFGALGVGT